MAIEIRVDRRRLRRWHVVLRDRLAHGLRGSAVRLRAVDGEGAPPPALTALLALERMVLHGARPALCDRLDPAAAAPDGTTETATLVIDCSGAADTSLPDEGVACLRPLFDGVPGEGAMMGTLMAGSTPGIAIEDCRSGAVLATARPSGEAAKGLTGGVEAVTSRTMALIERVVVRPGPPLLPAWPSLRARPRRVSLARLAGRSLAHAAVRAIYRLCFNAPHWRIGWRFVEGPGAIERGTLAGPRWNSLADPGRSFFADPFPMVRDGRCFVFCEHLDHRAGKGVIAAIEWGPSGPKGGPEVVLEEPWHLSYPFLIAHEGALWMVPESALTGEVALYRCVAFPHRWERVSTLVAGAEVSDATVFRHDGRFWMMSATRRGYGGYSDTLAIHHAADLLGPWEEHEARPVLIDALAARPGGAVVRHDGALWRPIQDCTEGYGKALSVARIDRLDTKTFAQTIVHRLEPGRSWPGTRLHTLNRCGRLECIDGSALVPRLPALRPAFAPRDPAGDPAAPTAAETHRAG